MIFGITGGYSPVDPDAMKIQRIHQFLERETSQGFSGTVLISGQKEILFAQAYGLADREHAIENKPKTVFEIASITKLFTVVSILQLAERSRLSIDDKITEYLGPFPPPKDQCTIRHLLLHTGGLVPRGYDLEYDSRESFVKSVRNAPSESIPGEKYRYTNAGYTLLAAVIEVVSGEKFSDFLARNIFDPLELQNTVFGRENSESDLAVGYRGNAPDSLEKFNTSALVWGDNGPSGIVSDIFDLNKFLVALEEGKILSKMYLSQMFMEQMPGESLGFHVNYKPGIGKILARGGGLPHFESQIVWYLDQNIKLIFLINNHLGRRRPIWDGIEEIIFRE